MPLSMKRYIKLFIYLITLESNGKPLLLKSQYINNNLTQK